MTGVRLAILRNEFQSELCWFGGLPLPRNSHTSSKLYAGSVCEGHALDRMAEIKERQKESEVDVSE
jgi:hypothetical protein